MCDISVHAVAEAKRPASFLEKKKDNTCFYDTPCKENGSHVKKQQNALLQLSSDDQINVFRFPPMYMCISVQCIRPLFYRKKKKRKVNYITIDVFFYTCLRYMKGHELFQCYCPWTAQHYYNKVIAYTKRLVLQCVLSFCKKWYFYHSIFSSLRWVDQRLTPDVINCYIILLFHLEKNMGLSMCGVVRYN